MRALFADSGYRIAHMYPSDQLRERAREVAASLESVQIVTTQMVLTEALNFMARLGELRRRFAAQMVQELEHSPDVEVIPQTDA